MTTLNTEHQQRVALEEGCDLLFCFCFVKGLAHMWTIKSGVWTACHERGWTIRKQFILRLSNVVICSILFMTQSILSAQLNILFHSWRKVYCQHNWIYFFIHDTKCTVSTNEHTFSFMTQSVLSAQLNRLFHSRRKVYCQHNWTYFQFL